MKKSARRFVWKLPRWFHTVICAITRQRMMIVVDKEGVPQGDPFWISNRDFWRLSGRPD